jgi:hypothetical protein
VNRISIRYYHYIPESPVAKPIHASFRFAEARRYPFGPVIMVLKL